MKLKSRLKLLKQVSTKVKASGKVLSVEDPPNLVVSEHIVKHNGFIVKVYG